MANVILVLSFENWLLNRSYYKLIHLISSADMISKSFHFYHEKIKKLFKFWLRSLLDSIGVLLSQIKNVSTKYIIEDIGSSFLKTRAVLNNKAICLNGLLLINNKTINNNWFWEWNFPKTYS